MNVTHIVSKWLHHLLHPFLLLKKQYLIDSLALIRDISSWSSLYVFSSPLRLSLYLYPSIPIINHLVTLEKHITPFFPFQKTKLILDVIEFINLEIFLSCNNSLCLQNKGTTMESNNASNYASLFLTYKEDDNPHCTDSTLLYYKCYIDDKLQIWNGFQDTLKTFLQS